MQRYLAEHRRKGLARWVGNLAVVLARGYENDNADGTVNGEWRLLDVAGRAGARCVFDVGANHGSWAEAALDKIPTAVVHAFEIVPSTREALVASVGRSSHVVIADCGLAAETGFVDIWLDENHDDVASMVGRRPGGAEGTTVRCSVVTGDEYAFENGLETIDLLKIDVEGAELQVLEGFAGMLAEGRIGAIQFEFTGWAAVAGIWLRDYYQLLEPLGYEIGKIYPTYVEWREYHPSHEIFVRANFLAIHRSRPDLREQLS